MEAMLKAFNNFREEETLIGQIAIAYSELEFDLCNCVAMAIDSLDVSIKAMFRDRGEERRINIADAVGRPAYAKHKLADLDVPILQQQKDYFAHVSHRLHYLNYEGRKRAGKIPSHAMQVLSLNKPPPLYK